MKSSEEILQKFESTNSVFIADTHFGHANIIKYCDRPFIDIDEMDALMLSGLQHADELGKTIFHMGDFVFKPENLLKSTWRPSGEHYIILGNHDKYANLDGEYRTLYKEFFTHIIGHSKQWRLNHLNIMLDDDCVVLSHEPQQHLGIAQYNIYGHHHNNMIRYADKFIGDYDWLFGLDTHFNVGVELTDYKPVSYDELKQISRPKKPT